MRKTSLKGFTLIETVVGAAVFLIVALGAYGAYTAVFRLAAINQTRIIAVTLADEQFEIIRNMPYSDIGVVNGNPDGSLPQSQNITRGGLTFSVDYTIRDLDLTFDGTVSSSTNHDTAPADNKFVQISVNCPTCANFVPIVVSGQIAPKNLENSSSNGALFVQVLDANGLPVQGASVGVSYTATTSPVIINDTTNNTGVLGIVDIPPAVQAYNITVSKSGYSTDQTYPVSGGNPTPVKVLATVAVQQLTQASFSIDRVSTMNVRSVTPTCTAIPNFDFTLKGAKTIGTNLPKYSQTLSTNSAGILALNNMEWDSYTFTPIDTTYDIIGLNPLSPISLSPNSIQSVYVIAQAKNPKTLIVTVKDSATGLPISGATVHVTGPSSFDQTVITGQGYIDQADWSGGSGQASSTDITKYFSDNGGVDTATSTGNIVLKKTGSTYSATGTLDSSTFDTGSASNFFTFSWNPVSQPNGVGTSSIKLQFATNASSTATTTWSFFGPDGTANTFYTTANATLNSIHNNMQYARYRATLSTASSTVTPNVSDIFFTYTSNCVPPGQVVFSGLSSGTYTVVISKTGYTTQTINVVVSTNWVEQQVLLAP